MEVEGQIGPNQVGASLARIPLDQQVVEMVAILILLDNQEEISLTCDLVPRMATNFILWSVNLTRVTDVPKKGPLASTGGTGSTKGKRGGKQIMLQWVMMDFLEHLAHYDMAVWRVLGGEGLNKHLPQVPLTRIGESSSI